MEKLIRLINHEVWIEIEDRGYLKWGHYPKTDGKLDPLAITRAFYVKDGKYYPLVVGKDKISSSKEALFLEFDEADALGIEYNKGIYSLTEDNKWIFGKNIPDKYKIKETREIIGYSKVYLNKKIEPLGFELEIIPDKIDKKIKVDVIFRGKQVPAEITLRNKNGEFKFNSNNEIKLAEGINVLSARYVDTLSNNVDKRHLVSTITINL
ncbi:hypothetical protein J422_02754 [Methanocaldococcus villosus KIN24-T80]|uniref:Uncharacterized protein n=1 Tax=Methanocaldococcus villosus KIN24-T80 TaxID=1069083 RepID=N6V255_9EURY|nr:hypothetical protein [Methanocaldococcus villosus]ENN96363.1 hypothetical protein J422_02754 [Methanocaldococcus villosus KIN24-T80]